jgi:hypothetical protein
MMNSQAALKTRLGARWIECAAAILGMPGFASTQKTSAGEPSLADGMNWLKRVQGTSTQTLLDTLGMRT